MINQHSKLAKHNTVINTTTSNVLSSSNKTRQAEKTATPTKDSGMRSSATRELHLTKYFFYQHPELTNTTVAPAEITTNVSLITSDDYDTNTIADEEEDEEGEDDYVVRDYCCDNEKVSSKINHHKHIEDYCEVEDDISIGVGVENHYQIDCINDEYGNTATTVEELHNKRNERHCEYGDKITGLTGNSVMNWKDKQPQSQRQDKRENLVRCISCQERYCSKNGLQRLQQVSVNTNNQSIINFRSAISMGSNATNTTTTNTNNSTSSNIGNSDNLSPVSSDSTPTTNSPSNSVSKQQVRINSNCCEPLSNAAASISRCSTQISSSSNTNLTFDHQNQPVQQRHQQPQHYFHHQNQQQFVYSNSNNAANQYTSGCKQSCEKTRSLRSISLIHRRNSSPSFESCQQHNYLYPQKKPQLSIEEQLRRLLEIDTTTTTTDQSKNINSEQHSKQVEPTTSVPTRSCFEATSCHQNSNNNNNNKSSLTENIRDTIQEKGASWFTNMKKNSAGNTGKLGGGASGRDANTNESPFGGSSRARSQPNISPNDRLMIFMLASRSTNTNSTVERNARILKWLNNCKSAG